MVGIVSFECRSYRSRLPERRLELWPNKSDWWPLGKENRLALEIEKSRIEGGLDLSRSRHRRPKVTRWINSKTIQGVKDSILGADMFLGVVSQLCKNHRTVYQCSPQSI